MPAERPLRPNDPSVITNLETALTPTRRPGPLDIAWHWRWEIGTTAILAGFTTLIATSLGSTGLIAAAGAGLAALSTMMCWPPARVRIVARVRCVIMPHRIRKGCANAWIQTRGGTGQADDETALRQVRRFIEANGASRFELAERRQDKDGNEFRERVVNRAGYREPGDDGEYWILLEVWRIDVCAGLDYKAVARVIDKAGFYPRAFLSSAI